MKTLKYLGIALFAGAAGAAIALLLAPEDGQATRRRLGKTLESEKRRLAKRLNKEKAHLMKKGRAKMEEVAGYVTDEIETAQKKISKVVPF